MPVVVRSRRRWPWALVVLVVIGWIGAVGVTLLRVNRHVRDGVAAVSAAQGRLDAATISDPQSPDLLAPVVAAFGAAHRDLDSPLLAPIRFLPVAGRQLRAVRNLAAAAQQVGSIGQAAIVRARAALRAPHATGPDRVAAIDALAAAAGDADSRLAQVSLGSRSALFGFVGRRYDDFARRLAKVKVGVHKGAVAAKETAALLRGPSHLLLLAANNAEMRDGSGMFLSATQVDIVGGSMKIGQVYDTGQIALSPGAVPLTGGYATVWGPYLANEEWRNLGMSASFDETAALAARMWKARSGVDVDGVLAIDIAGLRMLLAGTGAVDASGTLVTSDNVVQLLMHDQYLTAASQVSSNEARRDQLGRIADSVVQAVQRGRFDTGAVAKQLPSIVAGRHLMMWSASPPSEAAWQAAGVGGALGGDTLLAAVQNMGANKLDQFASLTTDVHVGAGTPSPVTVVLHIANHTPAGQPPYIAGVGIAGVPPNTYLALATLTMPGDAEHVLVDGAAVANNSGLDGLTRVVAAIRTLAPGSSVDVTVTFSLPGPHGRLQVESAARIPAATISVRSPAATRSGADELRPLVAW